MKYLTIGFAWGVENKATFFFVFPVVIFSEKIITVVDNIFGDKFPKVYFFWAVLISNIHHLNIMLSLSENMCLKFDLIVFKIIY